MSPACFVTEPHMNDDDGQFGTHGKTWSQTKYIVIIIIVLHFRDFVYLIVETLLHRGANDGLTRFWLIKH